MNQSGILGSTAHGKQQLTIRHHAYIAAGGMELLPAIKDALRASGVATARNADLYIREYVSFGVDDVRELRWRATARAIAGGRRVFVIITPSMSEEAQNALLKILEDPPADSLFLFLVPLPNILLQTLRSRVEELSFDKEYAGVSGVSGAVGARLANYRSKLTTGIINVQEFLAATPKKRIEMLKLLHERGENDVRDLRGAVRFLRDMELTLASGPVGINRGGLEAIYRAKKYIMDKGSLVKTLLEQVALLAPRSL